MQEWIFSDEDADRINRDAVAVEGWRSDPTRPNQWPSVLIDAGTRPDLADLGRVLGIDNPRAVGSAQWFFSATVPQAILAYELRSPAVCRFNLVFDLPRCRPLLEMLLSAGGLFIVPGGTSGFGVTVSGARHRNLRDFLASLP
jgi:hypothetical protein